MLPLIIIFSILILLMLLRFGVIIEYGDEGFRFWGKIGFISFRLDKKETEKQRKKVVKEIEKTEKKIMPGSLNEFLILFKSIKTLLGRLKRRLLIKELTLNYVSASENPADTAILYGAAHAVYNTVIPVLESHFRIKHKDLDASANFDAIEPKIYIKVILSIAVWEIIYVVSAIFPVIAGIFKKVPKSTNNKRKSTERKDGHEYGKSTDQRSDGKDDGKNEGND